MSMSTSRGFLLILFLATVACIVVVQRSMDGWILSGGLKLHEFRISEGVKGPMNILQRSFAGQSSLPPTRNSSAASTEQSPAIKNSSSVVTSKKPLLNKMEELRKNLTKIDHHEREYSKETFRDTHMKMQKIKQKKDPGNERTVNSRTSVLIDRRTRLKEILAKNAVTKLRNSPLKAVKSLPLVNPDNVTRIFLVTYFRSGSSFVGELLQQNWKTFYQYEPLHFMTIDSRIPDNRTEEAFRLFRGIYTCDFTNLNTYFQWVRRSRNQFLFTRSLFLWFYCRAEPRLCFVPDFVSAVCQRAPVRLVKVTRIQMRQLRTFLDENSDLKVKVIYLTRDPRGIISSRWSLDWCNNTDCTDPGFLCDEMANDTEVFDDLARAQPANFIRVRYEDIALNPMDEARRLFEFLNVPFPRSLPRFLRLHTTARKGDGMDPYSTRRNSSSAAFGWRSKLNITQVRTIQDACSDILQKLNYSIINSADELQQKGDTTAGNAAPLRKAAGSEKRKLSSEKQLKKTLDKNTAQKLHSYSLSGQSNNVPSSARIPSKLSETAHSSHLSSSVFQNISISGLR